MKWKAAMEATDSSPSFFIIYGWISGQGHGRKLKKLLQEAGFNVAQNAISADVIITHSAGFYLVPEGSKAQLLVLVGPTLNTLSLSNWLRANAENARMFWRDHHAVRGLGLNILHVADIFLRPLHNTRIAQAAKQGVPPATTDAQTIMIANRHDPWPHPDHLESIIEQKPWIFLSMKGAHENIWEEPEEYVKVIDYYAKRLLATTGK